MRKFLNCLMLLFLCSTVALADEPQRFSPEKFQADMEQFITQEACLNPEEAAKFFPLHREMHKKQRVIYDRMKSECNIKPTDEAGCKQAVQKRDMLEMELKNIQQSYHNKFFSVLPASKVYDAIKAEDRFHRRAFRNWGHGRKQRQHRR